MRALLLDLIKTDAPLMNLVPQDRWYSSGSVSDENVPDRRFTVIRYGVFVPGMAAVRRGSVTFWIHDDPGTYGDIDAVLTALTDRLDGVEQVADEEGNEIIRLTWTGNSGDLHDPGFRTITKTASFDIIGKGL